MIRLDAGLVETAQQGSRAALEELVRALERPVYNLALRMLANPSDAEDAAQEIIVKVITNLGGLRDRNAGGAWALRIAFRHLVHERRRGRVESARLTFRSFGEDILDGLAPVAQPVADAEREALVAQVKIGCTLALLTCLSRPLRGAYILGEVYEVSDVEAAQILDIENAAYRQRLRRARAMVVAFTRKYCGLVDPAAPCRCAGRLDKALALGRVEEGRASREAARHDLAAVERAIALLERDRQAGVLMRSNPNFDWEARALIFEP